MERERLLLTIRLVFRPEELLLIRGLAVEDFNTVEHVEAETDFSAFKLLIADADNMLELCLDLVLDLVLVGKKSVTNVSPS